jgi:hypothetical protein
MGLDTNRKIIKVLSGRERFRGSTRFIRPRIGTKTRYVSRIMNLLVP